MNILLDWLGEGGTCVEQRKADDRALVCAFGNEGKACPLNRGQKWWEVFKNPIADAIKETLQIKNKMQMHVAHEDDLHMCKACGCCLPLKVWVPIEHVRKVVDGKALSEVPAYCWMRNELNAT